MKELKLRPEKLASEADVSLSKLRRWFSGGGEPSYLEMLRVARVLRRPLQWFADGADPDADATDSRASLNADIRKVLLTHKQQRVREIEEIDALLGL